MDERCRFCGHEMVEHVCDTAPMIRRRDCDECIGQSARRDFEKDAPDGTHYRRPKAAR